MHVADRTCCPVPTPKNPMPAVPHLPNKPITASFLPVIPQVLLNAFGRALKDTFPPARCAALRALTATIQYYSPDEVACRALPAVAPLCVDPLPGKLRRLSCIAGKKLADVIGVQTINNSKSPQGVSPTTVLHGSPTVDPQKAVHITDTLTAKCMPAVLLLFLFARCCAAQTCGQQPCPA
jgi:hypothetical protein